MNNKRYFDVTYEIWDSEAIEIGDTDSKGFISEYVNLRNAITDLFDAGGSVVDASCYPTISEHSYLTCYQQSDDTIDGTYENRSIHCSNITMSSKKRLFRKFNI